MNIINAAILGIIQGLTEFLPVSSSGHLVLAQELLGFSEQGVLFETILHLGTSLAVVIYFREKLLSLKLKYIKLLIIGSIPAAIVGLVFKSFIEDLFLSLFVVGIGLLITTAFNIFVDRFQSRREKIGNIDSLSIGVAQSVAIIPGVSRSGATIFMGTALGIDRKTAAEFSFLLSLPAIWGANALELLSGDFGNGASLEIYLIGFIAAFVMGLLAISIVLRLLVEHYFKFFAIYTLIVGIIALIV